jgi:hypothetical protein
MKRPPSTSHYTGGDCSPSKKRDLGISKSTTVKILPDERGLLFADATNSCAKDVENLIDESDVLVAKPKTTGADRVKGGRLKARMKMEVVIPVTMGSTTQSEPELDIFS